MTENWLAQLQKLEKDLVALIGELLTLHNYTLAKVENTDLQKKVGKRIEFLRQCQASLLWETLSSHMQSFALMNLLRSLSLLVHHLEAQPDLNKFELPPGNPVQSLLREAVGAVSPMCRWLESEEIHERKHLKHQKSGKKGAEENQRSQKRKEEQLYALAERKRKAEPGVSQSKLIDIILKSGESPYKRKATIATKLREFKK
jgi:hypothetical protein